MELWIWIYELSIQVITTHASAIVTDNNTIWVCQWHNFEHYSFPELYRFWVGRTGDEVDKPLHYKWGIWFSRMDTGTYYYVFLELIKWYLIWWCKFRFIYKFKGLMMDPTWYCKHRHIEATKRFAKDRFSHELLTLYLIGLMMSSDYFL